MKALKLLKISILFATFVSSSGVEIKINCLFGGWGWTMDGSTMRLTCYATVDTPDNKTWGVNVNTNEIFSPNSVPEGSTYNDVKRFHINLSHGYIHELPGGVENIFPNLESFWWTHGQITSVGASIFEPLKDLLVVRLAYNKLVSINGDLFKSTRKIVAIQFSNNDIENTGQDLLTGLDGLRYADFTANQCIDSYANTTFEIQEMKLRLPLQCPPFITVPPTEPATIPTKTESSTTITTSTPPATTTSPLISATTPTTTTTTPTTIHPETTSAQHTTIWASSSTNNLPTTTISTTSEPSKCPIRCTINDETDEMMARIEELEKMMREVNSSPCSCQGR